MEEWKEVLGFDILFEVSNYGRVRTRYSKKNGYTKDLSAKDAARELGVGDTAISNCLRGRSHKSCGFSWRYANV